MFEILFNYRKRLRPGDAAEFENRKPVTAADKVTKDDDKDYSPTFFISWTISIRRYLSHI